MNEELLIEVREYLTDFDFWVGDSFLNKKQLTEWLTKANGILQDINQFYKDQEV